MISWPLKLKYRNKNFRITRQPLHPSGQIETKIVTVSRYVSKTNNSGGKGKIASKLRPRRKAYGPF